MGRKLAIAVTAALTAALLSGCIAAQRSGTPAPADPPRYAESPAVFEAPAQEREASPETAGPNVADAKDGTVHVKVTGGSLRYSNEYINVGVSYPVISGLADETMQTDLNARIFSDLKSAAERIEADSRGCAEAQQYYFEASFGVMRNDGTILSIREEICYWDGGAQETAGSMFINYLNTVPGRTLSLPDLFVGGADYAGRLNGAIEKAISSAPNADDYSFNGVSGESGFYIGSGALVIVFEMCSIAPSTMGEPEFFVPLTELEDMLIPQIARGGGA